MSGFERIGYDDRGTQLTGLLLRPAAAPRAAVAVYPTIMNPTPAVEAKARALAEAGYVAMICDFYGERPGDFGAAQTLAQDLRAEVGHYRTRLRAGLAALAREVPDTQMAAIGFCMGGQAALEMARDGADLVLAASFHGLLDTKAPAEPGAIKARMLVCHGDADALAPREQVLAFWEEMDHAGGDWHFHSYASVKHGFTNPNPPPDNSMVDYDASADRQSWAALMSLLEEVLGLYTAA